MTSLSGLPPKLRAHVDEADRRRRETNGSRSSNGSTGVGDTLRDGAAIAAVTVLLVLLWFAAGGPG